MNIQCENCGTTITNILEGKINYTSGRGMCNDCYDTLSPSDEDRQYFNDNDIFFQQ